MTDEQRPGRRRIRLPRVAYDGPLIAMVTIGTRDREPVFANGPFGAVCRSELHRISLEHQVDVLAYCFMPDHAHLVLALPNEVNLIDVVRLFKGRTAKRAPDYGLPRGFWQRRFYDHLLRPGEDPIRFVRYTLENPVRAGLVRNVDEYPHTGTFAYDVESLAHLLEG